MIIPLDVLDAGTLRSVIEEFVTRDGTEFTDVKIKVDEVENQLRIGKAQIVFDEESKTCNIIAKNAVTKSSVN